MPRSKCWREKSDFNLKLIWKIKKAKNGGGKIKPSRFGGFSKSAGRRDTKICSVSRINII